MMQRIRWHMVILGCVGLAQALPVRAHSFATDTVAAAVGVDFDMASAALDSTGRIGVCYYDATSADLKYARYDGAAWSTETVESDGMVGANCALTFDRADAPHIVYYDLTNNRLRHATKAVVWSLATIDAAAVGDTYAYYRISVAKDSAGNIGVAYYERTNTELRYARYAAGSWSTEVVVSAGNVGRYPSLDYNSQDRPGIAYMSYTSNTVSAART